jgi:hypothetical protein
MYKKCRNYVKQNGDGSSPTREKSNKKVVQSKHNNIFNNVKFATCFSYSNHHQADISVPGHEMFNAYSMRSNIVYICCAEFQTFRLFRFKEQKNMPKC